MTQSALARIETRYDTWSPALQKAARWATDHPADVCFLSLREQARRAGVVPPTMSRLAKALGFADFRAFQDNLRDCIAWVEVAACGGRKVVARLQQRETLLRDAGAYWHAPSAGSGGLR